MKEEHPSDILMARLLVGKGSEDEWRAVDEHARGCDRCRLELEGAEAARFRFERQVFPRTLPRIERHAVRPRRWLMALSLGTMAASTAAVFLLAAPKPNRVSTPEESVISVKGAGTLKLYGRRDGRVFPVEAATVLHPGDQVRFAVQSGGARFVLIASIDGRAAANIYFPSTPIAEDGGAGWQLVGDSIALDDALGPERIFALFSNEPLRHDEVLAALRETAAKGSDALRNLHTLPLPWIQASVLFDKSAGDRP
jgi:hypothetical protein